MALKDQLLRCLEKSKESELAFLSNLTDEDRAYKGSYEDWSAKDNVAHANYWVEVRSLQAMQWIHGEEQDPVPQGEQANVDCFERFSASSWEEVEAFAERAHAQMMKTIRDMEEETLSGPSAESEGRNMWESLVEEAYTHKLIHYAQFYTDRDQMKNASQLWKDWADLVSPLDASPEWQGRVRYNAACSLALAGDPEGALEELRSGFAQHSSLKSWSRLDSDLEILHGTPEYRELFAPSHWWEALESSPQAEALADQFLRTLGMFRNAVNTVPEGEWLKGETLYQRPAGLALHIAQSINLYSALKPGEQAEGPLTKVSWQVRESDKLPSQVELLRFLDVVERRMAKFILEADLEAEETMYPWTGSSALSRALYTIRHMQHHLADLAMELQRRGLRPPDWE